MKELITMELSISAIELIVKGLNQLPTGEAGDFTYLFKLEAQRKISELNESNKGSKNE